MLLIKKNKKLRDSCFDNHGEVFDYTVELENEDGDYLEDIKPDMVDIPTFNSSIEMEMWVQGFIAVLDATHIVQYKVIYESM